VKVVLLYNAIGGLMENYSMKVANNKELPEIIDASITRLEGIYNFKPHIGLLPDGELIMFVTHAHSEERITAHSAKNSPRALNSHVVLYRSYDGGSTWSWGRHVREMVGGHEPSVSIIDGIVFVLCHFQGDGGFPDSFAERDYPYSMIFRSSDGGETFQKQFIDRDFTKSNFEERLYISRNVIKLSDDTLFFGIVAGKRHISCYSKDLGITWECREASVPGCHYKGMARSFYTEALFFQTNSNRLMMMSRVDYDYSVFENPLPFLPDGGGGTKLDNYDGEVLFESTDFGLTWKPLRALGFPSLMYPSIVNLSEGRMLFTYTVREIPPKGTGCIHPKVGVQAILIKETENGIIDFDFENDVIIIDDSTPDSMRNAGCFGNTLELPDGSFITPFSYPVIDSEILKLADNKEYMKEEVFDYYAGLQNTYSFRYKDFINEDPILMELYLRRNFSALFLYAQCANKGGIASAVVKWRL
jgi:hypothetical protein